MVQQLDFDDALARLENISQWLDGLGFTQCNRVRVYSRNIRKMIEVEARGEMDALQASIPLTKASEYFWSYVDADEFIRAVTALRENLGDELAADPLKIALCGPADLSLESAKNSAGRNFMFELIMAGRLARAGFRPAFDKGPDVHTEFAGLNVVIQCKRPFSESGLEGNVKKAIEQLENGNADLNIIAVSVSRLLAPGDPFDIPEVRRHDFGHTYLQACVDNIGQQTRRFWFNKLKRAAILFYAFTPIRCQQGPKYISGRAEASCSLDLEEPTPTMLRSFHAKPWSLRRPICYVR